MGHDEKIITCEFMGGLGNQLFQAAHVIAQSYRTKRSPLFRPKSETNRQGREIKNYVDNIFSKLKFVDIINNCDVVREIDWSYNQVQPLDKNTTFWGYFQSEKNFEEYKKQIVDLFKPKQEFISKIYGLYPRIMNEKTISVHVRRGDSFSAQNIHPMVTKSYIDKCLGLLEEYSHIFCFSDDKEWVKNNLDYENITFVEGLEDYEELWMMSLCQFNIIPNSTFSWWAAYLNQNPNKRVMVPSIWFGPDGPENYKDIYVPDWEIIQVINDNGWLI